MESDKKLLYKEPRTSYLRDKLINIVGLIAMVVGALAVVVYFLFDPSYLDSLLRGLGQYAICTPLLVFLVLTAILFLYVILVFMLSRKPLEIYTDEIRLPYGKTDSLRTLFKREQKVLDLKSIVDVRLDFWKVQTPFKSLSSQWVWKCEFYLRNGERVVISRGTPGCNNPECLEAIKEFVQIVKGRDSENPPNTFQLRYEPK
jgi:hypothetical protein